MTNPVRLGRYMISERLGEGGAAEVFRGEIARDMAEAEGFSRHVAVKRIRPEVAKQPDMSAALLAEAELARQLHHGNIVQIYDVGDEDGRPYLVVELVDGVSLAEVVREHPQGMPVADALHVIEQVCSALHYAHERTNDFGQPAGIVHRDIKPKNILVSKDGVVKLADFGIAKSLASPSLTLPGLVKGTLGYLSPEQARGEPVGPASDQFATALVLYEMLTGHNPLVRAKDLVEYRTLLTGGVPPLTGRAPVDSELSAIVGRALSPAPEQRFASIGDLGAELQAWRVARKIRTSPGGVRDTVRRAMGLDQTRRQPRMLGDALGYLHPGPSPRTQAVSARPLPRPRTSRLWVFAAAGVGIIGIALTAFLGVRGVFDVRPEAPAPLQDSPLPPASTGPEHRPSSIDELGHARESQAQASPPPSVARPGAQATPGETQSSSEALTRRSQARARSKPPAGRSERSPGRIKINVIPWANVTINGKDAGRTPVDASLPPGPHRIFLHNPSTGQELERQVTIQSEQVLSITSW